MTDRREIETTVLNGFPCIVRFYYWPPEPDVGNITNTVEITEILTTKKKHAPWLESRLSDTEWDKLYEECHEYMREEGCQY